MKQIEPHDHHIFYEREAERDRLDAMKEQKEEEKRQAERDERAESREEWLHEVGKDEAFWANQPEEQD